MKGGRESKKEGFSINEHVETQFAALLSSLNLAFSSPPYTVSSRSQMNFDIPEEISWWGQLNTIVHDSVAWLLFKHLSIQAFPVFLLPAKHKASTLQATVLLARIPDFPAYGKGWGHSSSPSMEKVSVPPWPRSPCWNWNKPSPHHLHARSPFLIISVLLLSRLPLPRVHPISLHCQKTHSELGRHSFFLRLFPLQIGFFLALPWASLSIVGPVWDSSAPKLSRSPILR